MLNYQPPAFRPPFAPSVGLGQGERVLAVPPFGLPPVTTGIILTLGGLASAAVGSYMAMRGAKVIGKKIPTFWQWQFGTGGVGVTLAILGAVPLVVAGVIYLAGGIMIQRKLEEVGRDLQRVQ